MSTILSPLRYPGGKSKLSNYVKRILKENDMVGCTYIEPFAGGAGIACNLLINDYVDHIVINDLNTPVYSFWRSVVDHTDELCKLIADVNVNMDEWHKQKKIQSDIPNHNTLELGFAAFFLNRVNRSGIINGGVIGGKDQTGTYKMDARFSKEGLILRIKRIAALKNKISIYNQDIFDFIDNTIPNVQPNAFVYFDPPYYTQGNTLYENNFQKGDHARLATYIQENVSLPWMVSYDNVPEICSLYDDCKSELMDITYTAQRKYIGSEVIIYSSSLKIPEKPI
jgi:DNA adenine methylase